MYTEIFKSLADCSLAIFALLVAISTLHKPLGIWLKKCAATMTAKPEIKWAVCISVSFLCLAYIAAAIYLPIQAHEKNSPRHALKVETRMDVEQLSAQFRDRADYFRQHKTDDPQNPWAYLGEKVSPVVNKLSKLKLPTKKLMWLCDQVDVLKPQGRDVNYDAIADELDALALQLPKE